jgi:uncharacterized protein
MNPRRWLHEHSLKLLAIRDTPASIAGGVAIGIFFGFSPLFGLKTLLAISFAWLTRSNLIAAVLAVTAHDIILPLMPAVYVWEYGVGYWLLNQPHRWPASIPKLHGTGLGWRAWVPFLLDAGKPLLLGGTLCAAPFALLSFALTHKVVTRHQQKKHAQELAGAERPDNPS